jgi:hypothetical protein
MLSPDLIARLYKAGDMRPTGSWIICAGVGCERNAEHDVVHEPPDGQRFFVPLCEPCIESITERQLEYVMESHGFFGVPPSGGTGT